MQQKTRSVRSQNKKKQEHLNETTQGSLMEQILLKLAEGQSKQAEVMEKILNKLDAISTQKEEDKVVTKEDVIATMKSTIYGKTEVYRVCKGYVDPEHGTISYDPPQGPIFNTKAEAYERGQKEYGKMFNILKETKPNVSK